MHLNIDPSKIKGPYQLLAVVLIVIEASLGLWISSSAEGSEERIFAGILIVIVLIVFLIVFLIMFFRSSKKVTTHLPKVNVVFTIPDSSVKLDTDKCTYRIKKIKGKGIKYVKGNAVAVRGKEDAWQITIPQDVSSNEDTIELTLVDESNTTWKIGSFYPHVTIQKATTTRGEKQ